MSCRIGYINVQGLNRPTWQAVHRLLHAHYDYLFVAETWYVDHAVHVRDRCLIATTELPPPLRQDRQGRHHGGIYLLGTQSARARLGDQRMHISPHAITFRVGKECISGVYLPPSMEPPRLQQALGALDHSTIVLGDVNTRFADREHQQGQPGPPERLTIFSRWVQHGQWTHLKPGPTPLPRGIAPERWLTTDHCFVRPRPHRVHLQLWKNASVGIPTDHRYTMNLVLHPIRPGGPDPPAAMTDDLPRFRIRRLQYPPVRQRIIERLNEAHSRGGTDVGADDDLETLNAELVAFCQRVSEEILGRRQRTVGGKRSKRHASTIGPPRTASNTMADSIGLYKRAVASSRENGVIVPTPTARRQGMDATTEVFHTFRSRYRAPRTPRIPPPFDDPAPSAAPPPPSDPPALWSMEEIVAEVDRQDPHKGCGADGVHIGFLKILVHTKARDQLQRLYHRCLQTGRTPLAWNRSEIHLLVKDLTQARDATNVRPITLICIFRKVFECLLLRLHIEPAAWARLEPGQAGFRSQYSTSVNAAVVHHGLSSRERNTAVFLDFRAAFDTIDHPRLLARLRQRRCPTHLQSLITSLMCDRIQSRVLVNGQVSAWFPRTQGVLQGAPISPILFNIFVDPLIHLLNRGHSPRPRCLFYADDGVVVFPAGVEIQPVLNLIDGWVRENALQLNVTKCGCVSQDPDLPTLWLGPEAVPPVQTYRYLGFPMTANGIDFPAHLTERLQKANGRREWLQLHSDGWSPADRLRIFKVFLEPIYLYGAPLLAAWAQETKAHRTRFDEIAKASKPFLAWIAGSAVRWKLTANLCGLLPLPARFQLLRTGYQFVLEKVHPTNPLSQLLRRPPRLGQASSFLSNLRHDPAHTRFFAVDEAKGQSFKQAKDHYLTRLFTEAIQREGQKTHLSRLIPMHCRHTPGLSMADVVFDTPSHAQSRLLQYRRGLGKVKARCLCDPHVEFHRGHEMCPKLRPSFVLTKREEEEFQRIKAEYRDRPSTLTELDFLLNRKETVRVFQILTHVDRQLGVAFHWYESVKAEREGRPIESIEPDQ